MHEPRMYKSQAFFFGSDAEKPGQKNLRATDPMPRKERNENLGYVKLNSKPTALQCDAAKYQEICHDYGIPFETMYFERGSRSRSNLYEIIKNLFQKDLDFTMLMLCGSSAYPDGAFVSSSSKKDNLNCATVLELWAQRYPRQRHLFIILDTSYSGQWIKDLIDSGEVSITIQASCLRNQLSYEDKLIGGYFTHNLYRTLKKQINLPIVEPICQPQSPAYFGSFHYVYYYSGLKIKFESWADMRTAMGASPYGDWPRVVVSDSLIEDKKKLVESGSNSKVLNNYASTRLIYQKESFFVTNKHTDFNQTKNKTRAKSPIKEPLKILVSTYLALRTQPIPSDFPPIEFLVDKEGKRYEGNVDLNGNKEAFGVLYDNKNEMEYQGQFHQDMKWGKGILYDLNGIKYYQGEFANDVKHGQGKIFDKHGVIIFEGQFAEDEKNGFGTEYYSTGEKRFEGFFSNGKRFGFGSEFYKNSQKKNEGYWLNGIRQGKATNFLDNGVVIFRGHYSDGVIDGQGKLYDTNGILKYEGGFLKNKYHGLGAVYAENGELLQEGLFENGEFKQYIKFESRKVTEEEEDAIRSKVLLSTQRAQQEDIQIFLDLEKSETEITQFTSGRVLLSLEKRIENETKAMVQMKSLNSYKQKTLAPKKKFKNTETRNEDNEPKSNQTLLAKKYELMNNASRTHEVPAPQDSKSIDTTLESPKIFVTQKAIIEVSSTFDKYSNISKNSRVDGVSVKAENEHTDNQIEPANYDRRDLNKFNADTINQIELVDRKFTNQEMLIQNGNESRSPVVMNINDPITKTNFKVKDYLAKIIRSKSNSTAQEISMPKVNIDSIQDKPKSYTISFENSTQTIKHLTSPSKNSLNEKLINQKSSRTSSPKNLITKPGLKSNISFKALDVKKPLLTEIHVTPKKLVVTSEGKRSESKSQIKDSIKTKKSKEDIDNNQTSKKNSTVKTARPNSGSHPTETSTRDSMQGETLAINF